MPPRRVVPGPRVAYRTFSHYTCRVTKYNAHGVPCARKVPAGVNSGPIAELRRDSGRYAGPVLPNGIETATVEAIMPCGIPSAHTRFSRAAR